MWPEVFRRGVKALRRRGVALAVAEDAVQEAGLRAIALEVPFEDAEDLLRWVQTVSWRVVLDGQKRDNRLVYEVPDDASTQDVGREVEARLGVERLGTLVGSLSAEDQATLIRRPRALDRRTSTRLAVRRHRIRAQLLAMLEGVAAVVAFLRLRTSGTRRAAAVAMPVAFAATAWTLVPFDAGRAPVPAPRAEPAVSPVPPALTHAPAAAAGAAGPAAAAASTSDGAPRRPPGVEVQHPLPDGTGRVWTEPKEPHDSFACLALLGGPTRCVDLPVQVTD